MTTYDNWRRYPLLCVLLGHRWHKRGEQQGAYRGVCRRCRSIAAPSWMVAAHPRCAGCIAALDYDRLLAALSATRPLRDTEV